MKLVQWKSARGAISIKKTLLENRVIEKANRNQIYDWRVGSFSDIIWHKSNINALIWWLSGQSDLLQKDVAIDVAILPSEKLGQNSGNV